MAAKSKCVDEKEKTRIEIIKDLIKPHKKDRFSSKECDPKYEKTKALMEDEYQKFVSLCNYVSENKKDSMKLSCFKNKEEKIIFEIKEHGKTSQLSFDEMDNIIHSKEKEIIIDE